MLDRFTFERVIADRGYAGANLVRYVQEQGSEAVIPPHQRAKVKRAYDTWRYRERHLIECYINMLKHFRRLVTRFDKLDRSYLGFVYLVCALICAVTCRQNFA